MLPALPVRRRLTFQEIHRKCCTTPHSPSDAEARCSAVLLLGETGRLCSISIPFMWVLCSYLRSSARLMFTIANFGHRQPATHARFRRSSTPGPRARTAPGVWYPAPANVPVHVPRLLGCPASVTCLTAAILNSSVYRFPLIMFPRYQNYDSGVSGVVVAIQWSLTTGANT